jgi:hypothetical protein
MLFFKKKIFIHTYVDLITNLLNPLKPCQNQKAYQTTYPIFNKTNFGFFFFK